MRPLTLPLFLFLLFTTVALAADSYVCPMHCEGQKTYAAPGKCPVCRMPLEKQAPQPTTALDYRVDVRTPGPIEAGKSVSLTLTPRRTKDGEVVKELELAHERPMHLIVVSQDLSWFSHEHPEPQGDGSLVAPVTFPFGGNFVLYADFKPKGAPGQVVPIAITVDGKKEKPVPLVPTSGKAMKTDGYVVSVKIAPPVPRVGEKTTLTYEIKKNGKPVTDLEPYLGAGGHSVILSADTTSYLHSHPEGHGGDAHEAHAHGGHGGGALGPRVIFVTEFPRAGLYKAWAQFRRAGKVFTVSHVLRVP